jgi:hypothetical protein
MKCRSCGGEHDRLIRCEVAARIAAVVSVANAAVPNASAPNTVPNAEEARSAAWKRAHPEEYRKYQRDLMRARGEGAGGAVVSAWRSLREVCAAFFHRHAWRWASDSRARWCECGEVELSNEPIRRAR